MSKFFVYLEKVTLDLSLFTDNMPHLSKTEVVRILAQYGLPMTTHVLHIIVHDLEKAFEMLKENLCDDDTVDILPIIATEMRAFVNWAETIRFPSRICYPRNKSDLIKIIRHPIFIGNKIGLLGSTYSSENMFGHSDTILINFKNFNAFAEQNAKRAKIVDEDNCIVAISAGCNILEKHGVLGILKDPLLLPSCVIFTDAQYTGISATGCHVSYECTMNICVTIQEIEYLSI